MSIEGLEKIRKLYFDEDSTFKEINRANLIDYFMKTTIETLQNQSDEIANLRQELAKKEDAIDWANPIVHERKK